jgi:undecaprenyl-diphosphatase
VSEQPANRGPSARTDRDWLDVAAAWDRRTSARLRGVTRRRAGFGLAWLGAHLGDGYLWFTLAGLGLWLGDEGLRRGVLRWIISMAIGGIITTSTKFILRRKRPEEQDGFYSVKYDRHSFPSGHATRMGTIAAWGSILFPGLAWAAIGVALWTAWSRVALGIHFLLDVVIGLGIGVVTSLLVLVIMGR